MGAQWEFVASNPDGADAESKRTVRKAAMRAFRRNQRLERMQQFKKPGTTSSPESDKSSSSHAEEVKVIKKLKVEQGVTPRALPNNSLKSSNEEVPSVSYAPVEHSIDYRSACAIRPEPSPTTSLSNGVDLALGFSSPIGCGGPSNYQLLNHCEYLCPSQLTVFLSSFPGVAVHSPSKDEFANSRDSCHANTTFTEPSGDPGQESHHYRMDTSCIDRSGPVSIYLIPRECSFGPQTQPTMESNYDLSSRRDYSSSE
jgi:hypothetical protein